MSFSTTKLLKVPSSLALFSLMVAKMFHVPSLTEVILNNAALPNFKVIGARATLLEGELNLPVLAVGDEPVVVNKPLDAIG